MDRWCKDCDNNVIDEIRYRKGHKNCQLCADKLKVKIVVLSPKEIQQKRFNAKVRSEKYRMENPEKVKAANKRYYTKHKAESLARCQKNRALKKLAEDKGGA